MAERLRSRRRCMLDQAGFPVKHVSIVTQNLASDTTMHGYITPATTYPTWYGHRSLVGGLLSLLIGSAFLWVPGFGRLLVVDDSAALLLTGVEGAW